MLFKVIYENKCSILLLYSFFCLFFQFSFIIYIYLQDTCNRKNNQQNLGTIKSSNLCTEIIEYTSPTETAVCNLASIALPRYVREKVSRQQHACIIRQVFVNICVVHFAWYYFWLLQGVPIESHPSKLVGSRGSNNRYFDFDKLAEV